MSNPWDDLGEVKDSKKKSKSSTDRKKTSVDDFSYKNKNKNIDIDNDSNFFDDFFNNFFGFFNQSNEKIKNNLNENNQNGNNFLNFSNLKFFFVVIFCISVLWLFSGFYTVKQEEGAIIMRFGKYVREEGSGLHYHLPYPIEEVIKEKTTRVRVIKIGGDENVRDNKLGEGWALTGDENIVNLELNVQWKVSDLKKFILSVRDKEQTIYDATQSAIREVISRRKLASILTSGRSEIEEETKQLLQQMLDSYNIGVNVIVVQMLKIDPPAQVIDSFRDVQTARVDKESEINKAYKYKNDIIPKVRGEAGKIIEDANGYAIAIVNKAQGDAVRFNYFYNQYKNAPFITRKRMYLDVMENLFENNSITIIDDNVKNVFLDSKNINEDKKISTSTTENEDDK